MAWKNIFKSLKKHESTEATKPEESAAIGSSPSGVSGASGVSSPEESPLAGSSKVSPSIRSFVLQKEGNSFEECEDTIDFSLESRRFAVSDGATESVYSDFWSQNLVRRFLQGGVFPEAGNFHEWLEPVQEEWKNQIDWDNLPWFTEQKIEHGAYAAFVGIEFSSRTQLDEGRESLFFKAVAVGDCCLFQVRDNQLIHSFPIRESSLFDNHPHLLSSSPNGNPYLKEQAFSMTGSCLPGDYFILASDAMACWFLAQWEAGEKPWETLEFLNEQIDFEVFVMTQRHEGWLKNDDTALMILSWDFEQNPTANPVQDQPSNPSPDPGL